MRIVCLTDTHGCTSGLQVPDGDLLLHAGDHTRRGTPAELQAAADWLRSLPHKHKAILAGNHDFGLEGEGRPGRELFSGMTYLEDSSVEIEGLRIYGSPWTPVYGGVWAFQKPRGPDLAAVWENIPMDTHLLLTHGPPANIADLTFANLRAGCRDLAEKVAQVKPLLHLFGHIHEGYGVTERAGTFYANGCNVAVGYLYNQPPHVFDWDGRSLTQQTSWRASDPMWSFLLERQGSPRNLRDSTSTEWQAEVHLGHAFWLEVDGPGEGIRFVAASPSDTLQETDDRKRYPLSFGVKLPVGWLSLLNTNLWCDYHEVPGLSVLH